MTCDVVIADATTDQGVLRAYYYAALACSHLRDGILAHVPNSPTPRPNSQRHRTFLGRPEQEHCALLASTRGQCLFGVSSCSPTLYRACVAVDVAPRPLGVGSASCRARSVQLMRITSCMQGVGWGGNTLMFQRLRPSGRSWPATFAVRLIDSSTILPDRMRLCIVPVVSSVEGIVQQPYMRLW
jgi:hypothetical protein